MVDLISGGRLELGLGAGYRVPEFELFGTDFTARYRILDQQVGELRRLWGDGGLTPAPAQERLPVWLGYQGPKGARRAGLMGEGLLTIAKDSWPHYRDGLAEGGHDPAAARMAGGVQAYVTDDPERDWPLVAPHIAYAQDSYRRYMVEGTGNPVPRPVDPERLRARGPEAGPMSYFLFGTPEDVAKAISDYVGEAPVAHGVARGVDSGPAGGPGRPPRADHLHPAPSAAERRMTMGRLDGKIAIITGAAVRHRPGDRAAGGGRGRPDGGRRPERRRGQAGRRGDIGRGRRGDRRPGGPGRRRLGAGDGRGGGDRLRRPGHPAQQRRRDGPGRHEGPAGERGGPRCLGRDHAGQPARRPGGHPGRGAAHDRARRRLGHQHGLGRRASPGTCGPRPTARPRPR